MMGCSNDVSMELNITKRPYWLAKNPMNGASPDMYIIEPASIHIVIRKILNKSGRTLVNT